MKKICLLLFIIAATRISAQNKEYAISFTGLGSLKLGMTQAEVEKLANQKIKLDNYLDTINDFYQDTAKLKYKNIPVQLEFERNYYEPNVFHMRLIGIRANSPLCKTPKGIGIGSGKLQIIAAYEEFPITIQSGYVNYYETEKGRGKSTISIIDDTGAFMLRFFLFNYKVISFELKGTFVDQLSEDSEDGN